MEAPIHKSVTAAALKYTILISKTSKVEDRLFVHTRWDPLLCEFEKGKERSAKDRLGEVRPDDELTCLPVCPFL